MTGSLAPAPRKSASPSEAWFMLLGAATAVLVAGAVAAGLALTGGDAGPAAVLAPPAATTGAPEGQASEAALEELTPRGTYRMTRTLVSSSYEVQVPERDSALWTFVPQGCQGDHVCFGRIESSSGRVFRYDWDGRRLAVTAPQDGRVVEESPCLKGGTGKEVPGSLGRVTHTAVWTPLRTVDADPSGMPVRLEGGQRVQSTYEGLANCSSAPTSRARYRTTLVLRP